MEIHPSTNMSSLLFTTNTSHSNKHPSRSFSPQKKKSTTTTTTTSATPGTTTKHKKKSKHRSSANDDAPAVPLTPKRRGLLSQLRQIARGGKWREQTEQLQGLPSLQVESNDLMEFLTTTCPIDVVPHILAYAGPQTCASLRRVNRHWKGILDEEETWRVLCEDLYKWNSDDAFPSSWKEYYRANPCVPVDYASIPAALSAASSVPVDVVTSSGGDGTNKANNVKGRSQSRRQRWSCRVLVRPGVYNMPETIQIKGTRNSIQITIERMELPDTLYKPSPSDCTISEYCNGHWSYSSMGSSDDTSMSDSDCDETNQNDVIINSPVSYRKSNKPLFRISRGTLILRNVRLNHKTMGVDIWGGNCAIHVEPEKSRDHHVAAAILQSCEVTSTTGRGIVVLAGAHVQLTDCYIHSCAATGIYIGGGTPESMVTIKSSDIAGNGHGNRSGGIPRLHSGICLEAGHAEVINCNISQNTASGITLVRSEQVRLKLIDSDLISNGMHPVEFPTLSAPQAGLHPTNGEEMDQLLARYQELQKTGNRMLNRGLPIPRSTFLRTNPHLLSLRDFEDYLELNA